MAARGGREDGGFQTRIVELGMPVNERKKGAHGLFEARVYSPLCTRAVLSFVYLSRLLFILTTACLWPRSSIFPLFPKLPTRANIYVFRGGNLP